MTRRWHGLLMLLGILSSSVSATAFDLPKLYRTDGSRLRYYLQPYRQSTPAKTLLVVLQDSDCNSPMNAPSLALFHDVWPTADQLFIEKYGLTRELPFIDSTARQDCPALYIKHDNLLQRRDDARRVIAALLQDFAYQHVVLVGVGEGGVVAAMLSARLPRLRATLLIDPGSRWFSDDLAVRFSPERPSHYTLPPWPERLAFIARVMNQGPFEVSRSNHGYRWWRTRLTQDLQTTLQQSQQPLLLLQMAQDERSSVTGVKTMVEQLQRADKGNISYILVPNLDHEYRGINDKDYRYDVIGMMRFWLNSVTGAVPDSWYYH